MSALVFQAACAADTSGLVPVAIDTIVVSISPDVIAIGDTAQATATLLDASGAEINGSGVIWSVSPASVASISTSGRLTALSIGTATIRATSQGVRGEATLTVAHVASGRLAFLGRQGASIQVYVMNADGTNLSQLTRGIGLGIDSTITPTRDRLTWSPDGTKLALAGPGIALINPQTGAAITVVTPDGVDPAWSSSGTKLRFTRRIDSLRTGVYDANADGSGAVLVVASQFDSGVTTERAHHFSWSSDLSEAAFVRSSEDVLGYRITQVYIARANGIGLHRLTTTTEVQSAEGAPSWSPDGRSIAFWSCIHGIAVINSDGSGPIRTLLDDNCMSNTLGIWTQLSWSPDGKHLAILLRSATFASVELWIVDVSGTTLPRRVSPEGIEVWAPAWTR